MIIIIGRHVMSWQHNIAFAWIKEIWKFGSYVWWNETDNKSSASHL